MWKYLFSDKACMQKPPNSIIKAQPEFIKFVGKIIYLLSKYRITRVPGAVRTLTWFETGCWCRDDQDRDTGRLWLKPISQFPWARYPFDQTAKKGSVIKPYVPYDSTSFCYWKYITHCNNSIDTWSNTVDQIKCTPYFCKITIWYFKQWSCLLLTVIFQKMKYSWEYSLYNWLIG